MGQPKAQIVAAPSITPRFSGVAFGADDMETVSTVSIPLPTVLVSLHQEMGQLLVGDRKT